MAQGANFGAALAAVNAASPFNKLAGFEIVSAGSGAVTLALDLRSGAAGPQLTNHAGALHAGVQAALLDTACGYAAGTLAGDVVTLQLLSPVPQRSRGRPLRGAGAGDEGGRGGGCSRPRT